MPISAGIMLLDPVLDVGQGFTGLSEIVSTAFTTITGNVILATCFAAGLLGVGFRVIRQAKRF